MAEDLENEKFVKCYFTICSTASGLVSAKKDMKNYSDELDWEVTSDKEGYVSDNGARYYEIKVYPKKGFISPEELREKRSLLIGFTVSILRDVLYLYNPVKMPNKLSTAYRFNLIGKKKKQWNIEIIVDSIFVIECDLKKLIKLEQANKDLTREAFGIDLVDIYDQNLKERDSLFSGKEKKRKAGLIVNILQEGNIQNFH